MEARGSRVICYSREQILLVQHHDQSTGETYWLPPGGGREDGETYEETAVREVREETGIDVIVRSQLPIDVATSHGYRLFVGEPKEHLDVSTHIDPGDVRYWRAAAWVPVSMDNPLGRMNASHWSFLVPVIRWLVAGKPVEHCGEALIGE